MEVGPEWFHKRILPIINAWQNQNFPMVEKYFLIAELLKKRGDIKGNIIALSAIPELSNVEENAAAKALLTAGLDCYSIGDGEKADQYWREVAKHPNAKSSWSIAMFNLGILSKERKKYPEAIEYFTVVLNSEPNDKERGASIMETYRNYSHQSCLEISKCYEYMGKYNRPLSYALKAKKRYPYFSWCGTCKMSARWESNKHIAYLSIRAYGFWGILFIVIIIGFCFYRNIMKKRKFNSSTKA